MSIGSGFDNGLFEYVTAVLPITPLPTITTANGFKKREREHGFRFGTVAATITAEIGFINGLDTGYEYDIVVTPTPAPVLTRIVFGCGFEREGYEYEYDSDTIPTPVTSDNCFKKIEGEGRIL